MPKTISVAVPGTPKLAQASDPRPAYDRLEGFKPEED